jgi:ATP-dependent Clp protease ATP-binding subunit ClpB
MKDERGQAQQVTRDQITDILKNFFRPEFLNRVDEIVVFKPLTRENLSEIVGIQLGHVSQLLADRGLKLEISPSARQWLAEVGYDPEFGARPLKRAIQREIQDPLALKILSGEFLDGDTIKIDLVGGGLNFTKA